MEFCAKCGKELPPGATFCPNCGTPTPLAGSAAPAPSAPVSGFDSLTKDRQAQDYWLRRLFAFFIDAVIVFLILGVIAAAVAIPLLIFGSMTGGFAPMALIFGGVFSLLSGLIFVLYFAVAESATGASIGKRVLGLRVVSRSGASPNFAEAFIRNLSKIYWILLLLDVIVGLATSKGYQQKYSDQFLGTTVTRA